MNSSNLKIKLIIGLGNPDKKYGNTYHNVGFLFIDYLIKNQQNYQLPITNYQLLKSNVYMNESGAFVKKALKKALPAGRQAAIKPEELLIVQDDSDLELGKYKFSFGRGAAGHHGVESVIKALGTKDFWRLRIGVRPPQEKIRQKAERFILKKISAPNKKILEEIFEKAASEFKSYGK